MSKYPCEEVTFDYYLGKFKYRLWFDADKLEKSGENPSDIIKLNDTGIKSAKEVANEIAERSKSLNAVQIINRIDNLGYMIYTVPFEERKE